MSRLPGREPTRVTIPAEHIEVVSFIGAWEHYAKGKICVVEGCDHIVSGRKATPKEFKENPDEWWIFCGDDPGSVGAAVVADKRDPEGKRGHRGLMICPHCLADLEEVWRAANGDPE
jgi:hypothetical protein